MEAVKSRFPETQEFIENTLQEECEKEKLTADEKECEKEKMTTDEGFLFFFFFCKFRSKIISLDKHF